MQHAVLRRKRILSSITALLVTGAALLITAPPASAACSEYNCFIGGQGIVNGTGRIDADGIYSRMSTEYGVNVPFTNGTVSTIRPTGAIEAGFNVRGIQIGSSTNGSYAQIGYTAGCGTGDTPGTEACTGINAQRGVLKKVFIDGARCQSRVDCDYFVSIFVQALDGGADHTYQIQRNITSSGARWRFFFDGGEITAREINSMTLGYTSFNSERLGIQAPITGNKDYPLNMAQDHWTFNNYHRNGDASSNPPGTLNYRSLNNFEYFQRGIASKPYCGVGPYNTNQGVRVTGTC